jgi:hypothetical protein
MDHFEEATDMEKDRASMSRDTFACERCEDLGTHVCYPELVDALFTDEDLAIELWNCYCDFGRIEGLSEGEDSLEAEEAPTEAKKPLRIKKQVTKRRGE